MSECVECGANDWTFWGCSYGDNEYVVEACRGCTRVKPDGFILQLTDDIREELRAESDEQESEDNLLNVEVVLKTDSEKIDRIDQCVMEILCRMPKTDEEEEAE